MCDPGPILGAFQPVNHKGFVSDYVHTQLQGLENCSLQDFSEDWRRSPLVLLIVIPCNDSKEGPWNWSECDSRLVSISTFLILAGVFQRHVLIRFVLLCPDLVTSGLLFDVVAAWAVALLVGRALWEGKLVHLGRLLFHSQERLYRPGQRQIRERTAEQMSQLCSCTLSTIQEEPLSLFQVLMSTPHAFVITTLKGFICKKWPEFRWGQHNCQLLSLTSTVFSCGIKWSY